MSKCHGKVGVVSFTSLLYLLTFICLRSPFNCRHHHLDTFTPTQKRRKLNLNSFGIETFLCFLPPKFYLEKMFARCCLLEVILFTFMHFPFLCSVLYSVVSKKIYYSFPVTTFSSDFLYLYIYLYA